MPCRVLYAFDKRGIQNNMNNNEMINVIDSRMAEHSSVISELINNEECKKSIKIAAEMIIEAYKNNKKIIFCGNGGSAADAQHLAAEMV